MPVAQHHVLAGLHHLLAAVVPGAVAGKRERVALAEMHVAKGAHGVGGLVEIGTVAGETGTLVTERHVAFHNLGVGVGAVDVVAQLVGVEQIDAVVHRLAPCLAPRGHGKAKDKEA